jgi:DNA-binding transcriptional LysR family regulator
MDPQEKMFLRVIEAGSLKAAAEQLNTDPSSVSRKIAALEGRLGVKLIERSTRRSAPTEAGSRYYEGLSRLFAEQQALEAQVTGAAETPTGRLRVAAPVDFGALFVAPILRDLQRAHPALEVQLMLGSSFADLAEQGIDVAVRIGRLPDSSLIARRLGSVPRVLAASPDYVALRGAPQTPEELGEHDFVFYTPASTRKPITLIGPDGPQQVETNGRFTVNSVTAIRNLVLDGMGIHLGPRWALRDALESGALVRLLPDYEPEAFPLHALYRSTAFVPAKIRAFVDRLAANARHLGQ